MLAMSTLMMPAPTMQLGGQLQVATHKPPEAKLLAIHPTHQQQSTPQHQMQSHHQQMQQSQQMQNQQIQIQQSNPNKPGKIIKLASRLA